MSNWRERQGRKYNPNVKVAGRRPMQHPSHGETKYGTKHARSNVDQPPRAAAEFEDDGDDGMSFGQGRGGPGGSGERGDDGERGVGGNSDYYHGDENESGMGFEDSGRGGRGDYHERGRDEYGDFRPGDLVREHGHDVGHEQGEYTGLSFDKGGSIYGGRRRVRAGGIHDQEAHGSMDVEEGGPVGNAARGHNEFDPIKFGDDGHGEHGDRIHEHGGEIGMRFGQGGPIRDEGHEYGYELQGDEEYTNRRGRYVAPSATVRAHHLDAVLRSDGTSLYRDHNHFGAGAYPREKGYRLTSPERIQREQDYGGHSNYKHKNDDLHSRQLSTERNEGGDGAQVYHDMRTDRYEQGSAYNHPQPEETVQMARENPHIDAAGSSYVDQQQYAIVPYIYPHAGPSTAPSPPLNMSPYASSKPIEAWPFPDLLTAMADVLQTHPSEVVFGSRSTPRESYASMGAYMREYAETGVGTTPTNLVIARKDELTAHVDTLAVRDARINYLETLLRVHNISTE